MSAVTEAEIAAQAWQNKGAHAPKRASDSNSQSTNVVQLTRASDVRMRPIDWLWSGFLPRGMLTLLAGLPGCGKSTLALALAATVTNAGRWPDGTPARMPGSVLIWSSEDAADTVLTPRLMACGADLSRVHFVDECRNADGTLRAFDPSVDMQLLQQQVENMSDLSLMILDPVLSAVGGDSHKAAETRRGLQAVVDMAAARNVAILGITHFRKGGSGTDPAERVIGSQAFVALARMVLIASKVDDPDNPKALRKRRFNQSANSRSGIANAYFCESLNFVISHSSISVFLIVYPCFEAPFGAFCATTFTADVRLPAPCTSYSAQTAC